MTPDEVSALIDQIPHGIHVDEFIVILATKAAEYEREECAKMCEAEGLLWGQRYAAAIRARGQS